MKKMNKILAMMIALGMAVSLMASCGEDNKQTSVQEGADTSATEQLTEDTLGEILNDASEIGEGTAGSSLKKAALAARIASYAAAIGFTDDQVEDLKSEMQAKFDAFDKEKQANIDNAFMEAFGLLDKAIVDGDYDSVKGQFEDAGAAEGLDVVLKAPGLKESYNVFKSAYLTMGNGKD